MLDLFKNHNIRKIQLFTYVEEIFESETSKWIIQMRLHIRYLTPAKQIFDIGFILDISHSSEDTFNTNWKLIQKFLNSIYSFSIPEDFCYLELFRVFSDSLLNPKYNNFFFQVVEDICIDKYDEKLYEQLKIYYKQIFERDLLAILKK